MRGAPWRGAEQAPAGWTSMRFLGRWAKHEQAHTRLACLLSAGAAAEGGLPCLVLGAAAPLEAV